MTGHAFTRRAVVIHTSTQSTPAAIHRIMDGAKPSTSKASQQEEEMPDREEQIVADMSSIMDDWDEEVCILWLIIIFGKVN